MDCDFRWPGVLDIVAGAIGKDGQRLLQIMSESNKVGEWVVGGREPAASGEEGKKKSRGGVFPRGNVFCRQERIDRGLEQQQHFIHLIDPSVYANAMRLQIYTQHYKIYYNTLLTLPLDDRSWPSPWDSPHVDPRAGYPRWASEQT